MKMVTQTGKLKEEWKPIEGWELLNPDSFANGGDRTDENTPEKEVCEKLGIKMLWNIGGEKTQSS